MAPSTSRRPSSAVYLVGVVAVALIGLVLVLVASGKDPATTKARAGSAASDALSPGNGEPAPSLAGAKGWLNTPGGAALTPADLSGKVVLYDFWTYSCVNCVRTLPYVEAWASRYKDDGLVVIGIHSPEFDFEKDHANVAAAAQRLGVAYPVALDDDMVVWNAFENQYWPAKYIADRKGDVVAEHFGEGEYDATEDTLRSLLGVAAGAPRATVVQPGASGATTTLPPSAAVAVNRETYLGINRADPSIGIALGPQTYPEPGPLQRYRAALAGSWAAGPEQVTSQMAGAAIVLAVHAREVNLVMAVADPSTPVDVVVTLDGKPLPDGYRTSQTVVRPDGSTLVRVAASDLYRIVLAPGIEDHQLRLTATAPGLQAFAFTFG